MAEEHLVLIPEGWAAYVKKLEAVAEQARWLQTPEGSEALSHDYVLALQGLDAAVEALGTEDDDPQENSGESHAPVEDIESMQQECVGAEHVGVVLFNKPAPGGFDQVYRGQCSCGWLSPTESYDPFSEMIEDEVLQHELSHNG